MRLFPHAALCALLLSPVVADVRTCACDETQQPTLEARDCALCRVAMAQPEGTRFFFIKDANPLKANRLLALPRAHIRDLAEMKPDERTAYWAAAIAKAQEVWGDHWGLAVNSLDRRTQCHMHIHIGKLREGLENDRFTVVDGPADIPLPAELDGLLVHPANGKLHVHTGDSAAELNLER